MAKRGIFQLKELRLFYSVLGGSSQGARELLEKTSLKQWINKNPQLRFVTEASRALTKHPYLRGTYLNKKAKVICIKNQKPNDIVKEMDFLRNQWGERPKTFRKRVHSPFKSIQGKADLSIPHIPKYPTP